MDGTLGIVGGGRMGEALLGGVLDAGLVPAARVTVTDTRAEHLAALAEVRVSQDNTAALGADVVLLALKPQVLPGVLAAEGAAVAADALVVSIAAGTTTAAIEGLLPQGCPVVRVMPNTPALVGAGMSVVSPGARATAAHVATARELVGAVGAVLELPESQIDAVTAVSGSGPAYVFLLAEAMAEAGVLNGLSRDDAVTLATHTVAGAGALLAAEDGAAARLREAVTSPGGTTAAALRELERAGVRSAVLEAVSAAVRRGRELG